MYGLSMQKVAIELSSVLMFNIDKEINMLKQKELKFTEVIQSVQVATRD